MGGDTLMYNGKNILGVPLGLSVYRMPRIPTWLGLWKVDNTQPINYSTLQKYWLIVFL